MVGQAGTRLAMYVLAAIVLGQSAVQAQDEISADTAQQASWMTLSGSASLTADFYGFDNPDGTQVGRRPPQLLRLMLAPTLSFGSWFSLPLNLVLTLPETNVTTPTLQAPTFSQLFANPINQLGFTLTSEKLNGSRLHVGTHTPKFSELSGGDLQIFGAGVDLRPGPVQLAMSGGIAQRAVAPDSLRGINGAYRRDMYMARLGIGTADTAKVGVNIVFATDDVTSLVNDIVRIDPERRFEFDSTIVIPADTVRVRAEEGVIASLDGSLEMFSGVTLSGEMAVSAFTGDKRADTMVIGKGTDLVNSLVDGVSLLLTPRVSTRADVAGTASLAIRQSAWGITFSALYMGAGFVPLGYPFSQTDRIDLKVAPSLRLLDGDIAINATVGQRVNNLSETKGEALTQFIANANANIRFSDAFSLGVSYANFGIRSNNVFDTLKIQNVSQSFSVDPVLTLEATSALHTVAASVAFDKFDDFNVLTGAESSNDTRSATLVYNAMLTAMPLTVGAMATYVENALFAGALIVRTVGANASYRLFGGSVVTTLSYTMAGSTFGVNPTDTQGFLKASARWNITKQLTLSGSFSNNAFQYGQTLPARGAAFSEQIVQLALTSTF